MPENLLAILKKTLISRQCLKPEKWHLWRRKKRKDEKEETKRREILKFSLVVFNDAFNTIGAVQIY